MDGSTAESVLDGFTRRLRTLLKAFRQTLTLYEQGKEMAWQQGLEKRTGFRIYFAYSSYSPWQRTTNENTNGLLRQYFPKGTGLSEYSQRYLTKVADERHNLYDKSLSFWKPAEVIEQQIRGLHGGVALQT